MKVTLFDWAQDFFTGEPVQVARVDSPCVYCEYRLLLARNSETGPWRVTWVNGMRAADLPGHITLSPQLLDALAAAPVTTIEEERQVAEELSQ